VLYWNRSSVRLSVCPSIRLSVRLFPIFSTSPHWDSCVQYHEKWCLHQFLTDFSPCSTWKCLEVDPIPGFKYSHLHISGHMHYRKMVSLELLFVLLCSRKKAGWWRHWSRQKGGAATGPKIWSLYSNFSGFAIWIQKSTSK
jgi:hypothetical protein